MVNYRMNLIKTGEGIFLLGWTNEWWMSGETIMPTWLKTLFWTISRGASLISFLSGRIFQYFSRSRYGREIRNHLECFYQFNRPGFTWFGDDGHTLSLFQFYSLKVRSNGPRIYGHPTLGERHHVIADVVNNSEYVIFLVSGAGKAPMVQKVLYSKYDPDTTPAQVIRPITGNLEWILDEEAGSLVKVNPKKK